MGDCGSNSNTAVGNTVLWVSKRGFFFCCNCLEGALLSGFFVLSEMKHCFFCHLNGELWGLEGGTNQSFEKMFVITVTLAGHKTKTVKKKFILINNFVVRFNSVRQSSLLPNRTYGLRHIRLWQRFKKVKIINFLFVKCQRPLCVNKKKNST